jgi:hypothetical protein
MQILSGLPSSDKRSEPLKVYIPSLNIVPILFMAAGGPGTAMDHRAERAGLGLPPNAPANTRNPGDAGAMDSLAAQNAFRKARAESLIHSARRRWPSTRASAAWYWGS